jgi:hypothetical protein
MARMIPGRGARIGVGRQRPPPEGSAQLRPVNKSDKKSQLMANSGRRPPLPAVGGKPRNNCRVRIAASR